MLLNNSLEMNVSVFFAIQRVSKVGLEKSHHLEGDSLGMTFSVLYVSVWKFVESQAKINDTC